MKKIIIPCLLLVIINGFSVNSQAQQKPSERSFVAEMKKIRENQAATNAKIRQMPTPSDNGASINKNQNGQEVQVPNPPAKTNIDPKQNTYTPADSIQQPGKLKPSARPMQKPVRH
jgi:hypothetical protein